MDFLYKTAQLIHEAFYDFHQKKLVLFCFIIFLTSLASYAIIVFLNGPGLRFVPIKFRRFLFINADKSSSGALQVGGIVFSLVSMIAITLLYRFFPYLISNHQYKIIACAYQSWVGILIYGYLDDCFEIRAIVKLMLQLGVVFLFCLRVSNVIYPANSALAFVVMIGFAVAIVNGSNLLDGLDTLTFKFSTAIYIAYFLISLPVKNYSACILALTCFSSMGGFYFFNKEPSKIHMGEIGVSSLGLSYVILSALVFDSYLGSLNVLESFGIAILPCVLPIVELGISFNRRILNNKSPFRGDKFHNHHILSKNFKLSASNASSVLGLLYFVGIIFSLVILDKTNVVAAVSFLITYTIGYYLVIGWKTWFGKEFKMNLSILGNVLVKKEVKVMPSNAITDFKIIINSQKDADKDVE